MRMTKDAGRECVDHLLGDLRRLWIRYELEYDITTVEFVGALECIKSAVIAACEAEDAGEWD